MIQGVLPLVLGITLCFLGFLFLLGILQRFFKRREDQIALRLQFEKLLGDWPLAALGTKIPVNESALRVVFQDPCLFALYRDRFALRAKSYFPSTAPGLREKLSSSFREAAGAFPQLLPAHCTHFLNQAQEEEN